MDKALVQLLVVLWCIQKADVVRSARSPCSLTRCSDLYLPKERSLRRSFGFDLGLRPSSTQEDKVRTEGKYGDGIDLFGMSSSVRLINANARNVRSNLR